MLAWISFYGMKKLLLSHRWDDIFLQDFATRSLKIAEETPGLEQPAVSVHHLSSINMDFCQSTVLLFLLHNNFLMFVLVHHSTAVLSLRNHSQWVLQLDKCFKC